VIRLIVRFANWLNARFPEKLTVTKDMYASLVFVSNRQETELSLLTDRVATVEKNVEALVARVGHLEASAVHKGAVQDLITAVKVLKDEQIAMKANLGWNRNPLADKEIEAMLNGEVIDNGQ